MASVPWTRNAAGFVLSVRLTPKGGRDAIDGIETLSNGIAVLKARVCAAPSEGEANAALVKLLARALGIPQRSVTIAGGATSRVKRVEIAGDANEIAARLSELTRPR